MYFFYTEIVRGPSKRLYIAAWVFNAWACSVVHGEQQPRPMTLPSTPTVKPSPPQASPRSQTSKYSWWHSCRYKLGFIGMGKIFTLLNVQQTLLFLLFLIWVLITYRCEYFFLRRLHVIYCVSCCFICWFFKVSRVEEKAKRKDRSRSKSPFRSFRWKKGTPKASGTHSDDEGASAALQGTLTVTIRSGYGAVNGDVSVNLFIRILFHF